MTISAEVFDPVATVTVVDVVFRIGVVRMNTEPVFADDAHCAVWISVYAPELLPSLHVGAVCVFADAAHAM
jgi:hypothetical protein